MVSDLPALPRTVTETFWLFLIFFNLKNLYKLLTKYQLASGNPVKNRSNPLRIMLDKTQSQSVDLSLGGVESLVRAGQTVAARTSAN